MSDYPKELLSALSNSLKEKIETYCDENNQSKGKFAEKAGMSASSLSHILSGERIPTHEQFQNLSTALDKETPEDLIKDLATNFEFLPSAIAPSDMETLLKLSCSFTDNLKPYEKVYCYLQCSNHVTTLRAVLPNGITPTELALLFPRFLN